MFYRLSAVLFAAVRIALPQTAPLRADLPPVNEIWYHAVHQESNGSLRYLRGDAKLETSDMVITADEIDFDSDTNWATARGHVHLQHYVSADNLYADHGEYNIKTQVGRFYSVSGTAPAKIVSGPGLLTTSNPFTFQAQWAQRIKDRYILHKGFLTDCKVPKPWWRLDAPVFDVIPGDRAIARNAVFSFRHIPLFYLPIFYHPLGRNPRQSGFLTPNVGHSTLYGYIVGLGYYWAISRSYDMTAIVQDFTSRGPALRYDFRGKPNETTDFNFNLYGVDDHGVTSPGSTQVTKEGGVDFELTAKTEIWGFTGRLDYNYLSSFLFRAAFAYSLTGAVASDVYSIGFLQRHFDDDTYTLNFVAERNQLFEAITIPSQHQAANDVIIDKLPAVEFSGRDQNLLDDSPVPAWFSFGSSAGMFSRYEPTGQETPGLPPTQFFQTGEVGRIDLEPHVWTSFQFAGFSLAPGVTFGATDYTNSYSTNSSTYAPTTSCNGYPNCPPIPTVNVALANATLFRKDADFVLDFRTPTLEKIYTSPKWLHLGRKIKHVIEGQATYEYVTGINEFQKTIHFDATDIISNTNQLTISLTNRLYKKDSQGNVSEILSWEILQARYFDPTFGGAVVNGERNVIYAGEEISPFTFFDGPRGYSPIISTLRISIAPILSLEWRSEYDPLRHKFLDNSLNVGVRRGKYFASVGETQITTNPLLIPQANQIAFSGGYGSTNRKGLNVLGLIDYDALLHKRLFDLAEVTYNTDCCGFSFQIRQYNIVSTIFSRNENQYFFSFSLANIGTFGSLQKHAGIF